MPLKDKIRLIIVGSIIIFFLYFLIAAKPLNRDLYFLPIWSSSIETEIDVASNETLNKDLEKTNAKVYPFLMKNKFGYFSDNGKIIMAKEFMGKVSASSSYWCQYSIDSKEAEIYDPVGKHITTIKAAGFIHIVGNKIYLFMPGGYGVSEYDTKGTNLWKYEHTAAITAFHSSEKGVVIGYSDGKIAYLDKNGNEVFNFYPGGSVYQVISGLALSNDGKFIACVSGIEKQRILLIRIMERQYKIVKHEYLKGNLYRQVFVAFDGDSSCAIFESSDGIGIIDCKSYKIHFIDEKDVIVDIGDDEKLVTILTQKNDRCKLIMIEKPFQKIATTTFNANETFLLQDKNKLFIGSTSKISAIEIKN
ncbi:MAG: hypothetical protein ACTTKH_02175 [Treponema sp.]